MKELLLERLIKLSRALNKPGFGGDDEQVMAKFRSMPEKDLLVLFETTLIESHIARLEIL